MSYKDLIIKYLIEAQHPASLNEISAHLKLNSKERSIVRREVKELVNKGTVVKLKRNRYGIPGKMNLVTNTFQAHQDGYGFVLCEDKEPGDIFVSSRMCGGAMNGDTVVVRVEGKKPNGKREGRIIQIIKRAHEEVVGRYEESESFGFVVPSDPRLIHDIYVTKEHSHNAEAGSIVTAKILKYPTQKRNPEGEVTSILGKPGDPSLDLKTVIKSYNLPEGFTKEAIAEARLCEEKLDITKSDKRKDLRGDIIFTIDGEDAKDFDDAVSIKITNSGNYKLSVHIADVSHYVTPNSALDKEAYQRGTSVYFPATVIPMLPFELSSGICSLKEGEDRLCVSVDMTFSPEGKRKSFRFFKSIIQSKKRLTYNFAQKVLDDQEEFEHKEKLVAMDKLASLLRKNRIKKGSLDFDLPEPHFNTDMYGKIISIEKRERNEAHKLIEEFMLAANEAAGDMLTKEKAPLLYRIHETPEQDKAAEVFESLKYFKYKGKPGSYKSPKTYQKILGFFEGTAEETVINMIILRTMKQARYSPDNMGHFGLAMKNYTHFTSPIRRYPDLLIHRSIKKVLDKEENKESHEEMEEMGLHCSIKERNAEQAERSFCDLKRAEFMENKVGKEYRGIISGVNSFGFFVELEDFFVEGLVRVTTLCDDYYAYIEKEQRLLGERTKNSFSLGDEVKIKVLSIDKEKRHINFRLA